MNIFQTDLQQIEQTGLYRKLREVSSHSGPRVTVDGKEVLVLASNDYLGYAAHPAIKQASQRTIEEWGAGAGASRLISGNLSICRELEIKLAQLKSTEDALVFSSGYLANIGLLSAVGTTGDSIYSDELNHASIIDGCRLSRAHTEIFPHRDTAALQTLLKRGRKFRRRIIVTDAVFSMDGDLAPLPRLAELAREYNALLIVDDAHGTGVLGTRGCGTVEHFCLDGKVDIIMGTMGKALGCFGAFVAGTSELREYLINRARSFIFTTALPPSVIGGALESLNLLEKEPERRHALWDNVLFFKNGLHAIGFNTLDSETPIIPLVIGNAETAVAVSDYLLGEGIFIQAIRPPTVPEGTARLRITIMAVHSRQDLEFALRKLEKAGKEFNLIH
jgi:glycine C-acetyltransferase/8-amino-7-oxononanoate synthase